MKEVNTGRSTRMALPSATSTWRSAAKQGRVPVQISVGHLEKEQQLETALDEYCQLREQDRSLTASRFCERYPSYRHSLRRLIDVHEAMEDQPALEEENWPELFSEFLGYEILHELGVGAIARVYLASEPALGGRLVAIKVAQAGGDEAEMLGKLTHPSIVPVFSVKHDEETDLTAVCMPYHGSATLADLLEIGFQDGTLPTSASVILNAAREREQIVDFVGNTNGVRNAKSVHLRGNYVDGIVRLGIQMAEALAYTHERGILHRDLKPSNVLLTPHGIPMLLDFNLASDLATGAHRLGGTLPYMPPEQIRDVHLQPLEADLTGDPRSDIFSLAVILYELLTGKLPFGDPPASMKPRQAAEEFLAAQQKAPRSVREMNPAVSPDFARLLHQCLALEPDERPASADILASELKKYFSPRQGVRRWTSRHRGLVATLVLVFMSMVSAAIWHLATRPIEPIRQYNSAITAILDDRCRDAVELLTPTIDRYEEHQQSGGGEFRFARGIAYQLLGEHYDADIDLTEAAKIFAENPLVLECAAYSKMHIRDEATRAQARLLYMKLDRMGRSSPEFELSPKLEVNYAFAQFDGQEVPAGALEPASNAIKKDAKFQQAYYIRGLAYYKLAGFLSKLPQADDTSRGGTAEIEKSIEDYKHALSFELVGQRLRFDAAMAYVWRDQEAPSDELKELLRTTVGHGLSTKSLRSLGARHSWKDDKWYLDLLESSDPKAEPPPRSADYFLTPPDYKAVQRYLLETQSTLPETVLAEGSKEKHG